MDNIMTEAGLKTILVLAPAISRKDLKRNTMKPGCSFMKRGRQDVTTGRVVFSTFLQSKVVR